MVDNTQGMLQRSLPKIAVGLFAATITPVIAAVVFIPLLIMIADYGCEGSKCVGVGGSLVLGIWSGMCAGPIAMFHTLLLGLAAAIIGARVDRIRWWSSSIVGFIIGCIPTSIVVLSDIPLDGIQTVIDKSSLSFTSAYLMMLLFGLGIRLVIILFMGFLGAVGGLSFWAVWRMLTRQQSSEIINSRAS